MIRAASTYSQTLSNNTHCSVSDQSSFAGKEKDSESGYHYFGARYYDSEVLTGWLSVDPMADKYPNISPFAHCAWTRPTGGDEHRWIKYNIVNNPVKLVDPDGREYGDYYDQNGEYLGSDGLEDNKVYQLNKGWRAKFENTNVNWGGTLSERHYKELQSKSTCLGTVQDAFVTGDPTSDKNIQSLHPAIRMKATYFIKEANANSNGTLIRISQGFRTYAEQNDLYAKGRRGIEGEKIVTNAKGGQSNHNFGLAFDIAGITKGKLDYNLDWEYLSKLGEFYGFQWGGNFKSIQDKPHFENFFGKDLKELQSLPKDVHGLPILQL